MPSGKTAEPGMTYCVGSAPPLPFGPFAALPVEAAGGVLGAVTGESHAANAANEASANARAARAGTTCSRCMSDLHVRGTATTVGRGDTVTPGRDGRTLCARDRACHRIQRATKA